MQYAKVVLGLPIEGPFDYIIPSDLENRIKPGSRVIIPFGNQKAIGFVIGISAKSKIKKLKYIISCLDKIPVINEKLIELAKKISEYYCTSFGMAIETQVPLVLRRGKKIELDELGVRPQLALSGVRPQGYQEVKLVHCLDVKKRWEKIYLPEIKAALEEKKEVIFLFSDLVAVKKAEKIIKDNFPGKNTLVLLRNQTNELNNWIQIKNNKADIVIGTRSAIFAPMNNLGLIIIDDEAAYGYKQDQAPHYNTREAAMMRAEIEKIKLILSSPAPSLESLQLAKKKKIGYEFIPFKNQYPEIKIIDMKGLPVLSSRRNIILSKYLENSIQENLNAKTKILILINRLGFATLASCLSCGAILKCPRCNTNLVFHYKENILSCHYCNHKIPPPKFCPTCNTGYIRYSGAGTEKIESEIARIFPQAKVKLLEYKESQNLDEADIYISTQSIIKDTDLNFGLIAALSIDNTLNHPDLRSAEKAFDILIGLVGLTDKRIIIQTSLPQHHIFKALLKKDIDVFYNKEIKQRKELKFPPFKHLAIVKLRGIYPDKVEITAKQFFDNLKERSKGSVEILSVNPWWPQKLRGNYYWQILLKASSAKNITKLLKTNLTKFKHSGIIVTVDIDPIQ